MGSGLGASFDVALDGAFGLGESGSGGLSVRGDGGDLVSDVGEGAGVFGEFAVALDVFDAEVLENEVEFALDATEARGVPLGVGFVVFEEVEHGSRAFRGFGSGSGRVGWNGFRRGRAERGRSVGRGFVGWRWIFRFGVGVGVARGGRARGCRGWDGGWGWGGG